MAGFFDFNLWMFFVIGVLGCALCYLRPAFIWWVTPIVMLVSILFLFNVSEFETDVGVARRPGAAHLITAIAFALVVPCLGAFIGRDGKPRRL